MKNNYFGIPPHLYSKFALVITGIYLLLTSVIYIDSLICSGFLCGLGVAFPVLPSIMLMQFLDNSFSTTNYDSFLFETKPGYFILIIIHSLLLYFGALLLGRMISKIKKVK